MDGYVSGQVLAAQSLIRQEQRSGDVEAAAEMAKRQSGPINPSKRVQTAALQEGQISGNEFVQEIEKRHRLILSNALAAKQAGNDFTKKEIAKQLKSVVFDYLERPDGKPIKLDRGDVSRETFAKRKPKGVSAKVTTTAEWRKKQTQARWKKEHKQWQDWKAGKRGAPPHRIKAIQARTRMQTGWTRWYNTGTIDRTKADPAVILYEFVLGTAEQHTEICLSREGWTFAKNDPRLAANTPPLHWGCKSKLVAITRSFAKANDIKRWTPKQAKRNPPAEGFGGRKAA